MDGERRGYPRQAAEHLRARVRFVDRKQLERCYIKDISRGGIFLKLSQPKPIDTPVQVTLELPGGREVRLSGVVVHCVTPEQAGPGKHPGVGVQFTDLTPEVRRVIEGVIADISSGQAVLPRRPSGGVSGVASSGSGTVASSPDGGLGAGAREDLGDSTSCDFEERKTSPRGKQSIRLEGEIPERPIEEVYEVPRPRQSPSEEGPPGATQPLQPSAEGKPVPQVPEPRQPTGGGLRAASVPEPRQPTGGGLRAASVPEPRQPTGGGLRAASVPERVAAETLRRLLWALGDVRCFEGRTAYEIIGVDPQAPAIEIRAACEAMRRAIDLANPPTGIPKDAVARVAQIVEALREIEERLTDPKFRAEYDRNLKTRVP